VIPDTFGPEWNDNLFAKSEIDTLTRKFFDLFTNTNATIPQLENIHSLCIPEAIIIKNTTGNPEIYNLKQFINSRRVILTDGTLTNFHEEETSEQTEIFGNIAHRFCSYKKSGVLSGIPFETKGKKTIQFVNTPEGWRISSVAWDDE
jgi:hypothetical protein